jgi:hypothetical protein
MQSLDKLQLSHWSAHDASLFELYPARYGMKAGIPSISAFSSSFVIPQPITEQSDLTQASTGRWVTDLGQDTRNTHKR